MESFSDALNAVRSFQEEVFELTKPPIQFQESDSTQVLEPEVFKQGFGYLIPVVDQINKTYKYSCYDACAALLRRLVETLLIELYEANHIEEKIKREGEFVSLRKLLNVARDESCLKLNHDMKRILPEIAILGNSATHNRISVVRRRHLEDRILPIQLLVEHLIKIYNMVQ